MCFSYARRTQITSQIYRDRLVPPMETAVFWIEHVAAMRGAPYLHSIATHFHTLFYYNLDVWAAFILFVVTVVIILWKIILMVKH